MSKKLTTEEFIRRAKEAHGDKYDYSKSKYIVSEKPLTIICPIHGEFSQRADCHLQGHNCPKCSYENSKLGNELFVERAKNVHGDKYDYSDVVYKRGDEKVCIICPKHGKFFQRPEFHLRGQGCPKCGIDKRKTGILGIGVNEIDRLKYKEAYSHWRGMIGRCYGKVELSKRPTYQDCSVCEEWLNFSNFIGWFEKHHVNGWHLDKDILKKGNKVYSPETCCFVPSEINGLFAKCNAIRGKYPIGIGYCNGKYIAKMRCHFKQVYLGRSSDLNTAFQLYKNGKEKFIKEVADKWKDKIEPRVYEALYSYKVEITD